MKSFLFSLTPTFEWHCFLSDLLHQIWTVLLAALLAFTGTGVYEHSIYSPTYTSSATLAVQVMGENTNAFDDLSTAAAMAEQYVSVFEDPSMLQLAADYLGLDHFPGTLDVSVPANVNLMTLTVTASDPQLTFDLISAILDIHPAITSSVFSNAAIELVSAPQLPHEPEPSFILAHRQLIAALAAAAQFLILTLLSLFKPTIKHENMLLQVLQLPLLGTVSHRAKDQTAFYEDLKKIANRLEYLHRQKGCQVFSVTSTAGKEGKSTVAAHTALILAQRGYRVLLAQLDGYGQTLSENGCDYLHIRSVSDFSELQTSLPSLRAELDFVILDVPAVSASKDAAPIACSDQTLFIVRANQATVFQIKDALQTVTNVGGRIAGCILNNVRKRSSISTYRSGDDRSQSFPLYLSDLWRGWRKFWWLCVLLAGLSGGIVCYFCRVQLDSVYTASTTFTVQTAAFSDTDETYSFYYSWSTAGQLSDVFSCILESDILHQKICSDLVCEVLPAEFSAKFAADTNLVTLTASGPSAQLSHDVLRCALEHYSCIADFIIGPTQLTIITEPEVPTVPDNRNVWQTAVPLAALFGFFLGLVWIVFYALLRRTIRTTTDMGRELLQPCLGSIPKEERDPTAFQSAIRLLSGAVSHGLCSSEKVLLFTATASGENSSKLVRNLASFYAKRGSHILVIDGHAPAPGHPVPAGDTGYVIDHLTDPGFDLLQFSSSVPLCTSKLQTSLTSLREQYDLIFIDAPACGVNADAGVFAGLSDAVLYVIRQDFVSSAAIRPHIAQMQASGARFMGCVLNETSGCYGLPSRSRRKG